MKKLGILIAIILFGLTVGTFFIREQRLQTDVTNEQTKVGFLLNGSCTDHSWGQSHFEGMEKSARELNLNVEYRENVAEGQECLNAMEELIASGCEIIICNSYGFGKWELEVAKRHPEVHFYHATGDTQARNMATYFGRMYQMRYLSGIVAGLQTETDEIGYVAAFPISEVNRGINAFTLGVRKVNPDAQVYVEWTDDWYDDENTERVTRNLLQHHNIDVLAMHTDSLSVLEVAEEEGIWTIGYNLDNSELFPKTFLTAPVWQWEKFYEPRILECLQNRFRGSNYWEGVESGLIALAPLTENVKKGTEKIVLEEEEKLKRETFDVFYGPIKDNTGTLRIGEGESMTDDKMLHEFNWYVEGVCIDGE